MEEDLKIFFDKLEKDYNKYKDNALVYHMLSVDMNIIGELLNYYKNNIDLQQRINEAIEYIKQYEEIYYPDEPLSEPVITYNLGVYEEDFDEAKLLDILRGTDDDKNI